MTSPPSLSFSKPAMPGDAHSVLVLVEDSPAMAAKWPDIRDAYLPNLLDVLRSDIPSVQMDSRWLTTSSASAVTPPPPVPIVDAAQARAKKDLPLGQAPPTKFTPAVISNAITILSSSTQRQNITRHLILVAASGPLNHGALGDATPSGFDSWDEIAIVLKQNYIRLHVILSIGAEMRTYHELFKRSLQLQNNSEVPAWFQVDSRRYSIRLSGRPQYVRGSVSVPIPLVPPVVPEGSYIDNNPSPPESSPPVSPPATVSTPSSPSHAASTAARKSTASPTTSRNRPRPADPPQSPPISEGGVGLVSYLQQMHGLTKKKSYGIKAPKKTYADVRLPNTGRPILPRLEVPPAQSEIYTYPTFDHVHGTEPQVYAPDQHSHFTLPRRHSADQPPTASLVARTNNKDDRRARRQSPWLPMAPLASSTPSSPTSTASAGTIAALQSLASMTPRLPDFVTKERVSPEMTPNSLSESGATYGGNQPGVCLSQGSPPAAYYSAATGWVHQRGLATSPVASAPSPTHTVSSSLSDASLQYQTSPPTPQLTYGSSPPSSTATTPSISGPLLDSGEDQPFVVSPEYEAMVNASYEEAVRSGAMHAAGMTPGMQSAVSAAAASSTPVPSPRYASSSSAPPAPSRQDPLFYSTMTSVHVQHAMAPHSVQDGGGYPVYARSHSGEDVAGGGPQNGAWPQYDIGDSYMPEYAVAYGHGQQWYST